MQSCLEELTLHLICFSDLVSCAGVARSRSASTSFTTFALF